MMFHLVVLCIPLENINGQTVGYLNLIISTLDLFIVAIFMRLQKET